MDRKIYWVTNPMGAMPFAFTNRREAEKSVRALEEKFPNEEISIFEEDVWTYEDIVFFCKGKKY